MSTETEFGYKVRQVLNRGVEDLGIGSTKRLHAARQTALEHRHVSVRGLQLAGVGHFFSDTVLGHSRIIFAMLALVIGASGSFFWQKYEQASEYAEIDSALLADELPPAAYLDRGFRAWLERSSPSAQ